MLWTSHRVYREDARDVLSSHASGTVDLIVTSPPYPMVKMWDEMLGGDFKHDPWGVYNHQHMQLRNVLHQCVHVLRKGGFMCINIGDAVRTLEGHFALYPNHSKIIEYLTSMGMTLLPGVIWRKPTNSPTKFMGSGMLPCGAYMTLEHEHILIFRKGNPRKHSEREKKIRRRSAYFWEERNKWFSDLWDVTGVRQNKKGIRTAAFPLEIPHRLINMFSMQGDLVLDPFLGAGTTMKAALINGRNSYGCEIRHGCFDIISDNMRDAQDLGNSMNHRRLDDHYKFTQTREMKHRCVNYDFACMSPQEKDIQLQMIKDVSVATDLFVAEYTPLRYTVSVGTKDL